MPYPAIIIESARSVLTFLSPLVRCYFISPWMPLTRTSVTSDRLLPVDDKCDNPCDSDLIPCLQTYHTVISNLFPYAVRLVEYHNLAIRFHGTSCTFTFWNIDSYAPRNKPPLVFFVAVNRTYHSFDSFTRKLLTVPTCFKRVHITRAGWRFSCRMR